MPKDIPGTLESPGWKVAKSKDSKILQFLRGEFKFTDSYILKM